VPARTRKLLLLVLVTSLILHASSQYTGKVIAVSDGDTISVLLDGTAVRVRLNGIDCPEKNQPFGKRAKQFTSELAFGKAVILMERGSDRYGRLLADVLLPDGRSLNRELVNAGLAWWYRHYAAADWLLKELETDARISRRGLRRGTTPVPPWEWRRPTPLKVSKEVP
jgi:micrococcal nuclease